MVQWWWRRALVTGASSGIGETIARELASAGVQVVLVARRRERLEQLAEALRAGGGQAEVHAADLLDADDRGGVEQRLASEQEPIDLLVNNAGFGAYGRFVDLDRDAQADQVHLNVVALLRLAHAALPGMIARGRGSVLNVSSVAAYQPQPYSATYAATKAFVNSLSHALHEETRGTGVSVTALCPGFTRTGFQEVAGAEGATIPAPFWNDVSQVARAGLDGAADARAVVVPGKQFQLAAALSGVMPASVTRRVVARQTRQRLPGLGS